MQFLDNIRSSKFLIPGLFLPQFVILGIYFHKLYLKFLSFCPNRNFLTWDPDARLVTSIRFAEGFRSFDPVVIVRLIFDSPTWPVLRNFPEALIVLIFGPGGTLVSLFTFGELVLLFLIVPWVLFRFSKQENRIAPALLFPIVWAGLLQNPGFMHYSFSGMLEVQGGLFFLPAALAFWELQRYCFDKAEILRSSRNPNSFLQEDSKQINSGFISVTSISTDSYSPWFLCISVNLLFHTKYPYGYIFIFFGCLFLITFRFDETKQFIFKILNFYGLFLNESSFLKNRLERNSSTFFIKNVSEKENLDSSLKNFSEERGFDSVAKNSSGKTKSVFPRENFFKKVKWGALIPIGFAILSILVSIIFSEETLPGKTKAYLHYAGVLIFWIDINIVVWKIFYGLRKTDKNILTLQLTDRSESSVSRSEVQSIKIASKSRSVSRNSDVEKDFSIWKYFWTYVIFPIGSWILIHPDRFSSSGSTIRHIQGVGLMPGQSENSIFSLTYFREILDNSFYAPYGGWVLCVGLILGIIFGVFRYWKNREVSASFFLFLSVLISILGLTLMTPNRQARHIYHLYPALLIAICIFCYEKFHEEREKVLSCLVYSIFIMFTLGYWSWKYSDIWERTNLCFSGTDRSLFFTAEDAESVFLKTVNRPSVLWNLLSLEHHNRPDVVLSFYRAGFYNRQRVREKNKKEEFDLQKIRISGSNWFIVADKCDEIGNRIGIPFEGSKRPVSETDWNQIRGACILKVGGE
ncbi:hypothetical protein IQB76_03590 [Leptospira borgpetersenii serovar Hardjo-bovis]|uniref:hypothetical protein n=1 Tax=Leptospira borgpetersenii TaxID=174 RepID=UPI0000E5766B|nr:hypothetical protein [Leptospira borgpetersenii]ABJ77778.1 Hypothetical protein LBL_0160 [Leptospira borgpetersenii serovar Hardjo-bovis str. L550]AMX56997.1 hypothetical protein LBK6_00855 [Leptospira borgpetersenii serovar Hardjo]AMX60228.1 hypothetical protein LBK9_00855 [Leptospira borgpetersenii serovar Hardjo]AMX63475.1 hypothetical protein LBK30_00870 [Leptospira borgpetersenii serovar Hardjo]AMX66714.1 hypothetical protein LBHA_00870 [Leptospira borgpetersenii serovar Hardjo]